MADIEVRYENEIIKTLSASGQLVLATEGKYCDDDITIDYVQPSADEIVIFPGSQQTNFMFTFDTVKKVTVKPIGIATNDYCSRIMPYVQKNASLIEYEYIGAFNSNFHSGASASSYCQNCKNISKITFPNDTMLPAQFTGFCASYDISAGTIPHTMTIKGLNFTNCTILTGFSTNRATADYDNAGVAFDIEWRGSLNASNINLRSSAAAAVRFTHDCLVNLINALGTGGGTVLIGQANLDSLSSAEIAIATAKGWTISA